MPTIFSHAIFSVLLGKAGIRNPVSHWFWFLTAVCAIIPDADVIAYSLRVERGSLFSHRGFTHSIVFAILFGAIIASFAYKYLKTGITFLKLFVFFSLATFSHPFLDMLTDGGSGVALLAPFSNERFFFPWQPIEVSPIGLRFFSSRGIVVILSEMTWIWLPAILVLAVTFIFRRARKPD